MDNRNASSPFRWAILLVGCLAMMSYGIGLTVYPPLFGEIAKDLQIDIGACLNLGMIFLVMQALCLTFGGILIDKVGLTFIVVFSLLCGSMPTVLMPWIGHSYGIVFTCRLLQGLLAICYAAMGPILGLWFPHREHGLAGGFMQASMGIGAGIGLLATHAVFETLGTWQKTVALSSIPAWVTISLALLILRRRPPQKVPMTLDGTPKTTSGSETYWKVMMEPVTWIGMFICFFVSWVGYVLFNVLPPYLETAAPRGLGLEPTMVGVLSTFVGIIGIPSSLIGGWFYDKILKGNAKLSILIGFSMTGVFAYSLLSPHMYQNLIILGVVICLTALGGPFMIPAIAGFVAKNYPPYLAGSVVGFWFGIGTLGGALGVLLSGMLTAKTGNFYWSFTSVSLASAMAFLLACGFNDRARNK